jgi:hypothetical protein
MPPPIYKIKKLRKIRQKYSNLRAKVSLQTGDTDNSEITDREGIDTMNAAGKGLLDDADWEYFGEDRHLIKSCNNGEPSSSASDEVEPVATTTTAPETVVVEVVEVVEPENQKLSGNCYGKYGEVDWESSLDEDEDEKGAENERDKSLGASVELSELLALERDNPDDFGLPNLDVLYLENSSEAPTANVPPTLSTLCSHGWSESREKLPATLATTTVLPSIEWDGYDDDYDYKNDDDKFPADEFVKTQAFITKAEWRLRKLLPYKKYRVRRPSLLRICYTVVT